MASFPPIDQLEDPRGLGLNRPVIFHESPKKTRASTGQGAA